MLMFISGAYAAAIGGAPGIGEAPAMPTVPSQPSVPAQPNIPTGRTGGIDLSGLNTTNESRYENIDLTDDNSGLQTEIETDTDRRNRAGNLDMDASSNNANFDMNAEATEAEINSYFEDILRAGGSGSPMRQLIERLPRFGMSFFRRAPSTYAPQDNVPVTQDYRIGVGDEITLTLWGIPEEGNYRVSVNRDGMATIPHIGAVRIAGYTL
ncbi:MAG: polysaccharide biosynthesis/export family protein, partial [Synergistaceae bacterium]|nr:polysaccharide biosynthesis/export family protein [Synergistaceae bacterium]